MSISLRHMIISCIPKGGKSRTLMKNWRPISLLYVAYKIYDILHYTQKENIPGLLMLIDFKKAFDSVS